MNKADKAGARKLQDSYFNPLIQHHFSWRLEPEYREALKQRQIWCEGAFAAQKWVHNLTRILRRGLEAAEEHCLLSAYPRKKAARFDGRTALQRNVIDQILFLLLIGSKKLCICAFPR